MNLIITGRNFEVSDSIRDYAHKRFAKLQKYFHQLIDMRLILIIERQDNIAEITINGDGVQFYAKEKAGDMYSSIDLLVDKIEQQVVRHKERHSGHKVTPLNEIVNIAANVGGKENTITIKQVSNKPLDEKEAYLQMKLDGKDFTIFKKEEKSLDGVDYMNKNYAVLYKDGNEYMLIDIPFSMIQSNNFDVSKFNAYKLEIKNDSSVNPDITFSKLNSCPIKMMTVEEALQNLVNNQKPFVVFFNSESHYFNVVYRNGKSVELLAPMM